MKKNIIILAILLPIIAFSQPAQKTTLAVMGFSYTDISQDVGVLINDSLVMSLVKSNRFNILERSIRDGILKEKGFISNGECGEPNCLLEAGKILSVQKIIGGNISRLGKTWSAKIILVDINSSTAKVAILKDYNGKVAQIVANINIIARDIVQDSGSTNWQTETIQHICTPDGQSSVECQKLVLIQDETIVDSTDINQFEAYSAEKEILRKADAERVRKNIIADELLLQKKNKTKLRIPVLTYSALAGTAVLSYFTYKYYDWALESYSRYVIAATEEDAIKYRNEAEKENKTSAICSYAAIGMGAVGIVTWFIRKKAYPELSSKPPYLDLTLATSSLVLVDNRCKLSIAWRF